MQLQWYIVNGWHILHSCNTERGAKISLTRKYSKRYPNAKVIDSATFRDTEPMVETRNLLSGQTCMIRASEKGVGSCDPGTERYHCM